MAGKNAGQDSALDDARKKAASVSEGRFEFGSVV
jgi:hypothetical protein